MIDIFMNFKGADLFVHLFSFLFAVVFALTIHEFAHALSAYKQGDKTAYSVGRLSLNPLRHIDPMGALLFLFANVGYAKPVPINPNNFNRYKEGIFRVSVAGVVANFLSAFVFTGMLTLVTMFAPETTFFVYLGVFLTYLIMINTSLGVFNLLPIYPLDGFNAISSFLPVNNSFVVFLKRYGMMILLILILFDFILIPINYVYGHLLNVFSIFWKTLFGGLL